MTGSASDERSSTGHTFSGVSWLEMRFAANRHEYESQARLVGFETGSHILDAGCGDGSFLPVLSEIVGPAGRLDAVDLDPENVAVTMQRLEGWGLANSIEPRVGSVLALPYDDASFDGVWCANVTQYLSDEELHIALQELRRVVRSEGLVAVKDSDATFNKILPAPPGLVLRQYVAAAAAGNAEANGCLRSAELPAWLLRAGLTDVRRHSTLLEKSSPLSDHARQLCHIFLNFISGNAVELELPSADLEFWMALRQPSRIDAMIDGTGFYFCEGNTLAVGRVP